MAGLPATVAGLLELRLLTPYSRTTTMKSNTPPYPGPTPAYVGDPYNEPPTQYLVSDSKTPYDHGRFKPKKTVNDPFFLLLFILQVNSVYS